MHAVHTNIYMPRKKSEHFEHFFVKKVLRSTFLWFSEPLGYTYLHFTVLSC